MALRFDLHAGARRYAEESVLRIDRVQTAIGTELHPRDVVANRFHFPSGNGRNQHRQVGLAAGGRKRACHVLHLARRVRHFQDEHVLSHPAFIARLHRRDTQRMALLPQQRVSAIPGTVRPDLARLREVADVFLVSVARPRGVRIRLAQAARLLSADLAQILRRSPNASSTRVPTRAMMCMLATT